jgi:hypothetical protein
MITLRTLTITVPSHSTGLGTFSWSMPRVPVLGACACCAGTEQLTSRELSLTMSGYKGPPIVVPYALCKPCADVAGVNTWIGRVITVLTLVTGVAIAGALGQKGWLGLAIVLGVWIFVGLPAGFFLKRKCPVPHPDGRRRACDVAVSGHATESGSLGAFGKEISSGALKIQLMFADGRYATALAEALRAESERTAIIVELV